MIPSDQNTPHPDPQPADKKPWEPMTLTPLGQIGDILQGGAGKLSVDSQDSGDVRKPRGSG